MQPLDRDLRRKLESTIKSARDVAEAAARAALDQLGVSAAKPPAYLDETQRELRRLSTVQAASRRSRSMPSSPASLDNAY